MKKKITIIWEQGGNFGHYATLYNMGKAALALGAEVICIVPNPDAVPAHFRIAGIDYLQSPLIALPPPKSGKPTTPDNFASILWNIGFRDATYVRQALQAWRKLLDSIAPDAIIFDFSPFAQCAARTGKPWLTCAIGNSHALPALATPLPSIRFWSPSPASALLDLETKLIRHIQQAGFADAADTVQDVLRVDFQALISLQELDIYHPRDMHEYWGPLELPSGSNGVALNWRSASKETRIAGYLRAKHFDLPALAAALATLKAESHLAVPDAPVGMQGQVAANVHVHTQPVDFNIELPKADVVISHGGTGLVGPALMQGKAQLLLPSQMEQFAISRRLAEQKLAIVLDPKASAQYGAALQATIANPVLRQNLDQLRRKYANHPPRTSERVVARLWQLLEAR
ncbi:glycosyltransferase [Andreprevotia chitinilytica]|uniref:glycosyltransferase n=1 Tax=Andreprevotia chitinilytica TaxID=396808 RepID=UPI000550F4CC|nr:nucleotide disphospho-sugar-binding domain-containing protein [Andreprevotia chitinilytica]